MATKAELEQKLAALEQENARQKKIISSLVHRVEQGGGSDAYGEFEHAVALADQVREKTQALNETLSELESANHQLQKEIEERTATQYRLLDAKKDAENANLSKTKFLAAISHDLLQPLNAAQLYLGSLTDMAIAPDARPLVVALEHSLSDVESLITMLVDISKLDAGVVKADKQSFAIRDLLDNIANEFTYAAAGDGEVAVRYVPSGATVYSDSQLLARIIRNLMTNALRYTRSGKVLLGCRRRDGGLSIEVVDTGVGIPADKQQEIFQEFRRLGRAKVQNRTRLGLGLAIVDKISSVLGHAVSVESVPGQGSRFSVLVPFGTAAGSLAAKPVAGLPDTGVALRGARIWVVDNDPDICVAMSELLGRWGCDVVTATSLPSLQIQVDTVRSPVELLVVDYHLDNQESGLDVANMINRQRLQSLPTLIITANRSDNLQQQTRKSGYRVIHKPVAPLRLKTTLVHMLVGNREKQDERTTLQGEDMQSGQR